MKTLQDRSDELWARLLDAFERMVTGEPADYDGPAYEGGQLDARMDACDALQALEIHLTDDEAPPPRIARDAPREPL